MAKTKKMYSPRLDKEFELTVCEPVEGQIKGNADDITVVRASALEKILFDELEGAVTWDWSVLPSGAIIVDIRDDSGVHVAGVGDIASKGLKGEISRSFPTSTAWSRAISSAVAKYLGFEGRVYTDASFEVQASSDDVLSMPLEAPAKKAKPAPVSVESESPEKSDLAFDPIEAASTVYELEEDGPVAVKTPYEDVLFPIGVGKNRKMGELIKDDDVSLINPKPGLPKGRQLIERALRTGSLNKYPEAKEAAEYLLSSK